MVPHRRIRAHKPELVHHHQLSPEELEECETEPVDEDLRDLIKRLLTKNPNKRILLKEVKVHPWVLCGIKNPIEWLDKTDPEQNCHGTKIEVTTEDVEAAVSVPSIVTRAKAAFRKAAGTWVRGLRKRTSSSINVQDAKEKKVAEQPAAATGSGKHAQGQQNSFIGSTYDDPDKELQWMGGVEEPRDEGKLNKLAPAVSNSSTGSAGSVETVHGKHHEGRSHHWSMGGSHWPLAQPNDRKLRRKQSMSLLGSNVLGARRSTSRIRDPTHDAPITFKAEKVPPLLAPRNSHRVIRSSKSEDLRDSGPKMMAAHSEAKELRARDILNGALYPNPVESCDEGYDELPTNTPQPRSLYPVERINHAFLNDVPKTPDSNLKKRIDRQRRDEQEQARLRLGNLNIFDEDASDRPCPLSPDDETPINVMLGRENQRMKLEERERLHCVNSAGSLPSATPEGWSRESFYHPVRDWETAPIVMAAGYRNKGYFEPPSPSFHSQRTNGLVSSSSGEGFANTAGSSLTNSTSFPSIATNPSSVSSEIFLNHYSSKESSDPTNSTTTYCFDEAERKRIQGQSRGRKASELLFQPEVEDSGSESEGGFVFQDRRPKRTRSIAVGELARESNAFKDEALRRGSRPTRPKNNSRSSGSTVKMAGATLRGRRDQK